MAGIPLREALKIRQLIEQIQSGTFDANHVDTLLIKLRPYAGRCHVFREIADFVAHADARSKGVTCDSMTAFADAMRFFVEYTGKQRALDLTQPFPAYVYRLFISQTDRADERKLREQFRVSHQSLVKKIKSNFKLDTKSRSCTLRPNKDGRDFLAALQFVTGSIHSRPAFDIAEFHAQFYVLLAEWKIEHDLKRLKNHADKISAALLCLISGTEVVLPDGDRARCVLTAEHNYRIEIGQRRLPTGDVTKEPASFGSLQINGEIEIINDSQSLRVAYPVISTNLEPHVACHPSLFVSIDEPNEFGAYRITVLDTEPDMALTADFLITKASLLH